MPPKGVILRRPNTRSTVQDTLPQQATLPQRSPTRSTNSPSSPPTTLPSQETPFLGNSLPTSSNEDVEENEDVASAGANTTSNKKGGRGASLGKSIEKEIANNRKGVLEIEFLEGFKKPLRYASHLANGIGIIVRHSTELDLTSSWKKIPEMDKLPVYAGLDQWFHIKGWGSDPLVNTYIDDMFYESFKHWKGRLSEIYKKRTANGINPKASSPFDWIPIEKWKTLCDHFETSKFQKRSQINAANRSLIPYPHTSGSKSFTTRFMERENQSCVDTFGDTHMRDGEYVNDKAAQKHKEMQDRRNQANENVENATSEREIMRETLGARSGYERGMGSGVVPSKGKKRSLCESLQLKAAEEKLRKTTSELQDAVSLIKSQKEVIENYEDRCQKLEDGHNELKQLLMSLCAKNQLEVSATTHC